MLRIFMKEQREVLGTENLDAEHDEKYQELTVLMRDWVCHAHTVPVTYPS